MAFFDRFLEEVSDPGVGRRRKRRKEGLLDRFIGDNPDTTLEDAQGLIDGGQGDILEKVLRMPMKPAEPLGILDDEGNVNEIKDKRFRKKNQIIDGRTKRGGRGTVDPQEKARRDAALVAIREYIDAQQNFDEVDPDVEESAMEAAQYLGFGSREKVVDEGSEGFLGFGKRPRKTKRVPSFTRTAADDESDVDTEDEADNTDDADTEDSLDVDETVNVKTSDGKKWTIKKSALKAAKKRDPGLRVISGR